MSIWCTIDVPDPIIDIEEYLTADGNWAPAGEIYVDITTMHPDHEAAVRVINDEGRQITVSREHALRLRDALTTALETLDRDLALSRRRAAEIVAERAADKP